YTSSLPLHKEWLDE
ncbi:hypothetical protein D039_2594, partial [Vibrio parahaemolyticus EKP-028]